MTRWFNRNETLFPTQKKYGKKSPRECIVFYFIPSQC